MFIRYCIAIAAMWLLGIDNTVDLSLETLIFLLLPYRTLIFKILWIHKIIIYGYLIARTVNNLKITRSVINIMLWRILTIVATGRLYGGDTDISAYVQVISPINQQILRIPNVARVVLLLITQSCSFTEVMLWDCIGNMEARRFVSLRSR